METQIVKWTTEGAMKESERSADQAGASDLSILRRKTRVRGQGYVGIP
ncbi:MAG: hypothetical protein NC091_10730 [Bacteroides sp.]|nr:hypothetical protein [Bacteroides sp.]